MPQTQHETQQHAIQTYQLLTNSQSPYQLCLQLFSNFQTNPNLKPALDTLSRQHLSTFITQISRSECIGQSNKAQCMDYIEDRWSIKGKYNMMELYFVNLIAAAVCFLLGAFPICFGVYFSVQRFINAQDQLTYLKQTPQTSSQCQIHQNFILSTVFFHCSQINSLAWLISCCNLLQQMKYTFIAQNCNWIFSDQTKKSFLDDFIKYNQRSQFFLLAIAWGLIEFLTQNLSWFMQSQKQLRQYERQHGGQVKLIKNIPKSQTNILKFAFKIIQKQLRQLILMLAGYQLMLTSAALINFYS